VPAEPTCAWQRRLTGKVDSLSLRRIPLFNAVPDSMLDGLARRTTWRKYSSGQRIVDVGEETAYVTVLAQGSAYVYGCAAGRQPILIFPVSTGDMVDLNDLPQCLEDSAYLEAMTNETVALRIPRVALQEALFKEGSLPEIYKQSRLQSQRLALLFWEFATCDALTRLQHELARCWQEHPGDIIWVTHADLGHRVGVRREDVTKLLKHLKVRGIIDYVPHQRGIKILDVRALYSSGCPG